MNRAASFENEFERRTKQPENDQPTLVRNTFSKALHILHEKVMLCSSSFTLTKTTP